MIRARTIPAKTGLPFSLTMQGRYRLADLCEWLEINDAERDLLTRILFAWSYGKKATAAGRHVLVTGENFLWAINLPASQKSGGQEL